MRQSIATAGLARLRERRNRAAATWRVPKWTISVRPVHPRPVDVIDPAETPVGDSGEQLLCAMLDRRQAQQEVANAASWRSSGAARTGACELPCQIDRYRRVLELGADWIDVDMLPPARRRVRSDELGPAR
jgi:hypothetical protein